MVGIDANKFICIMQIDRGLADRERRAIRESFANICQSFHIRTNGS